jgi:hypothetical protein
MLLDAAARVNFSCSQGHKAVSQRAVKTHVARILEAGNDLGQQGRADMGVGGGGRGLVAEGGVRSVGHPDRERNACCSVLMLDSNLL